MLDQPERGRPRLQGVVASEEPVRPQRPLAAGTADDQPRAGHPGQLGERLRPKLGRQVLEQVERHHDVELALGEGQLGDVPLDPPQAVIGHLDRSVVAEVAIADVTAQRSAAKRAIPSLPLPTSSSVSPALSSTSGTTAL